MLFEPVEHKAVIVATNYLFANTKEFYNEIIQKKLKEDYDIEFAKLEIKGDLPEGKINLEQMKEIFPIAMLTSNKNNTMAQLNVAEAKLSIDKENFKTNELTDLKKYLYDLIDLKSSDISALGLNFIAIFNLGQKKLKILNESIEDNMPNFKYNKTFQLILPLQIDNYIATYKIRKLKGGDNTQEDRLYQIDVNFNFDLSQLKTKEKLDKIEELLIEIETVYYHDFLEECNNLLKMNDEKR